MDVRALTIFGLAAVGIILVIVVITLLMMARRRSVWEEFARRHELVYQNGPPGPMSVRGVLESRPFELKVSRASSDTDVLGVEEIRMAVEIRGPVPKGLAVEAANGLVGEIQAKAETDRITTGEETFDQAVIVKGQDPIEIEHYLNEARRRAIERLVRDAPNATSGISERQVFIQDREMLSELDVLERRLNLLLHVARTLDDEGYRT